MLSRLGSFPLRCAIRLCPDCTLTFGVLNSPLEDHLQSFFAIVSPKNFLSFAIKLSVSGLPPVAFCEDFPLRPVVLERLQLTDHAFSPLLYAGFNTSFSGSMLPVFLFKILFSNPDGKLFSPAVSWSSIGLGFRFQTFLC